MIAIARLCAPRRRRLEDEPDAGISMIELLVAIMLLGIVLTAISGLYVSGMRTVATSNDTNANTQNASNGMNEATRVIRAGTANPLASGASDPAFVEADPESLIMYAYVNLTVTTEQPVMFRLWVNGQRQLVQDTWDATSLGNGYWSFPSASTTPPDSTRILASAIAPATAGGPSLFTYYSDVQGTQPVTASGDLSTILSVRVTMTVQPSATDDRSPVTLTNLVGIPNLGALGANS